MILLRYVDLCGDVLSTLWSLSNNSYPQVNDSLHDYIVKNLGLKNEDIYVQQGSGYESINYNITIPIKLDRILANAGNGWATCLAMFEAWVKDNGRLPKQHVDCAEEVKHARWLKNQRMRRGKI